MDGTTTAGTVPVIDHDRNFKELLRTFFLEFLELFFPKMAEEIDRESIEFLSQELYPDLLDGAEYRADLVVKARFKDTLAFFLVHVEHQSTAPTTFPRRFFRYFSAIFEKHGLPIYPIVIYSHDEPFKAQPNIFRVDFSDGEVLRFRYRVVQLNRLSWRKFLKSPNPVASALMAKMKLAPADRPRVKVECLRLMMTLRLDPARKWLITAFVDTYLSLNAAEEQTFRREWKRARLPEEQKEEVMEMVTSWERMGIEKGRLEGRQEGRVEGRQEGRVEGQREGRLETLRSVLLDVLTTRFGPLDEKATARIIALDSVDDLRRMTHVALTASALSEVGL